MIVDGLTSLLAVKAEMGIPVSDITKDALLESLISSASAAVGAYLDRALKRATYTAEPYHVNNQQFLYLRQWPIASVTSVTLAGAVLSSGSDYFLSGLDAEAGRLYKPSGWVGGQYVRGTFPDVFAGARDIAVTYTAGYYLPQDPLYIPGHASSVPLAISYAINRAVAERARVISSGADGLASLGEGGLSYSWFGPGESGALYGGMSADVAAMLAPYKRREVA